MRDPARRPAVFIVAVAVTILLATPGLAIAWEAPPAWTAAGEVADWAAADAGFFRLRDDPVLLNRSQDRVDQAAAYARTFAYTGSHDAVTLDQWLQLPAAEQKQRSAAAADELDFLVRFRVRVQEMLQRTKQNQLSGWGIHVGDVTTVGGILQKLRTAVGLDPSNPYAWHLYAWFSQAVGDLDRAADAQAGAERALAQVPADALPRLRRSLALDKAWLAWDRGAFAEASSLADAAAALGADPFETGLIRGLSAAARGDQGAAFGEAARLRSVPVACYPLEFRTSGPAPEVHNVAVWKRTPSDFAERWIKALAWLQAGDVEMAAKTFGNYALEDVYPQAARFWNDAGYIYEATGRRSQAVRAWQQARNWRPYAPFFPNRTTEADISRLTGQPGSVPVARGFGLFYTAGNRLALVTTLVDAMDAAADEATRHDLAAEALDQAAACRDRGQYAAQAGLLRAMVYHRLGDAPSAEAEMQGALRALDGPAASPEAGRLLEQLQAMGGGDGFFTFFSQSGASAGRWAAPDDPEAALAQLRAAHTASPSDATRRDLARALIRGGDPAGGRALAAGGAEAPDLALCLEADRALGDPTLAVELAGALAAGGDRWNDPGLWALAGVICQDAGRRDLARQAFERALALDPGNHGLRTQLRLMSESD